MSLGTRMETVFEWLYKYDDTWVLHGDLLTEEQASQYFGQKKHLKSGRQFQVEVELTIMDI
jgi:hypothetical protein